MALKRVSDLEIIRNVDDLNQSTYSNNDTTLTKSLFEISWNVNPSSSSGDDNLFDSKAITLEALSSAITYQILYKDISIEGNKRFKDDLSTSNIYTNGNITQTNGNVSLNSPNANLNINFKDVSTTSETYKNNATTEYNVTSPSMTLSANNLTLNALTKIEQNVGKNKIILGNSSKKDVVIKFHGNLKFISVDDNGDETEILLFNGTNVEARGLWKFSDSKTQPIDGYIKHALYS